MKKFFILLLLSCVISPLLAQFPINETTGKICYSEMIETDLPKDLLYRNALLWINKTFGNYKNVVQYEDKETGKIVMKGQSTFYLENPPVVKKELYKNGYSYTYTYIINIDCRDNKYRYSLTDITSNSTRYADEEYSLEVRLGAREKRQKYLDDMLKKDTSNLNKKELRKWDDEVLYEKETMKLYNNTAQREQEEFSSLVASLKSGMIIKDNF